MVIGTRGLRSLYPLLAVPTNRAVLLPERLSVDYPASPIAFHTCGIISRCCGSISSASRGEMPKKRGSKSSTSSTTPAHLIFVCLECGVVAVLPKYVCQSQREAGISPIQSRPSSKLAHKLCTSGVWGKTPLIPMMAIELAPSVGVYPVGADLSRGPGDGSPLAGFGVSPKNLFSSFSGTPQTPLGG